jgi:hypothetical protein
MQLTGAGPLFGPVMVRESPSRQSLGRIQQITPTLDFPADSFFDIFVEIDTPLGPLHNEDPIRMFSVIHAIPPIEALYFSPFRQVTLYNLANQPVGYIEHALHVPVKPREIFIVFVNRQLPPINSCLRTQSLVTVEFFNPPATMTIPLRGYDVVLRGNAYNPGDGRLTIDTELIAMSLRGGSPLGPVHLRESPTLQSLGMMKAQSDMSMFPLDSFFDVFTEIEIGRGPEALHLYNQQPVHVEALGLNGLPPGEPVIGTLYQQTGGPVLLFNRDIPGQVEGRILNTQHELRQYMNCQPVSITRVDSHSVQLNWPADPDAVMYNIYRRQDTPFFDIFTEIPYAQTTTNSFFDVFADFSQYYAVVALHPEPKAEMVEYINRVGKRPAFFDVFAGPGSEPEGPGPKLVDVGIPLNMEPAVTDAESLALYIENQLALPFGTVSQLLKWDNTTQTFFAWSHEFGFGDNFLIDPGDYVYILYSGSPNIVDLIGEAPEEGEVEFSLVGAGGGQCGLNFITLPYEMISITNADELSDSIGIPEPPGPPTILQALDWDTANQAFLAWSNEFTFGDNFPVSPGEPYIVCATDTVPPYWP